MGYQGDLSRRSHAQNAKQPAISATAAPKYAATLGMNRLRGAGNDGLKNAQRLLRPIGLPFLEVTLNLTHRVGHVSETEHRDPSRSGEGVKGSGLHLDGENATGAGGLYSRCRLAERRVGGPTRTNASPQPATVQGRPGDLDKTGIGLRELGGSRVMVARALVSESAVDDNEVGSHPSRDDLPCRREADQEAAPARKQFLCHEYGERSPHGAADDPDGLVAESKRKQIGVVAGPCLEVPGLTRRLKPTDDVAIRIENTNRWYIHSR